MRPRLVLQHRHQQSGQLHSNRLRFPEQSQNERGRKRFGKTHRLRPLLRPYRCTRTAHAPFTISITPSTKAVATTTDADGKLRETIRYELDNVGRFSSAEISGPDGRLRLKSRYKYDDAGRILEEAQSAADGTLQHKIVYSYDSSGKQTGYSIFDASGKLLGRTSTATSRASPSAKPHEKTRR